MDLSLKWRASYGNPCCDANVIRKSRETVFGVELGKSSLDFLTASRIPLLRQCLLSEFPQTEVILPNFQNSRLQR